MVEMFAEIHSSDNLTQERKRRREESRRANPGIIQRRESTSGVMDAPFTLQEMRRATGKTGLTSPGKRPNVLYNVKTLGKTDRTPAFRDI